MANAPTWNTLWLDNLAKFAFPWNLWPNVLLDVFQKPHNLLTRGFHLPASTKIDLANTTLLRYMRYYFVCSWNWFRERTIINTRKPTSIFITSNHIFYILFRLDEEKNSMNWRDDNPISKLRFLNPGLAYLPATIFNFTTNVLFFREIITHFTKFLF